ncbi:hypothetical protein KI387_042552, partial [Taxus chinensis]
ISQTDLGIHLSQQKYTHDLLRRFDMADCKPSPSPFQSGVTLTSTCTTPLCDPTLYRQLVGSLMYLTHTHPDISFVVGLVSRFAHSPHSSHWQAAKRILRYLHGTSHFGLHYTRGSTQLVGYTDSDWVGSIDDRRSTSGYLFVLVLLQLLGHAKSNRLLHFHLQRQSTGQQL